MTAPRLSHRVLLAGLAVGLLALGGCGSSDDSGGSSGSGGSGDGGTTKSSGKTTCTYADDTLVKASKKVSKPPSTPAYSGTVKLTLNTNQGAIPLLLDAKSAPCAVNSFVSLSKQKFYDASPCNRVVSAKGQVGILQCGDPTGTGTGGPGYTYKEEVTGQEKYSLGVIAMAKRQDPASTGSQFFMMFADSSQAFSPDYTIVGKVADAAGLKVLQKAGKAATTGKPDGYDGKPGKPVVIKSVTIG